MFNSILSFKNHFAFVMVYAAYVFKLYLGGRRSQLLQGQSGLHTKFQAGQGYIVRRCLRTKQKNLIRFFPFKSLCDAFAHGMRLKSTFDFFCCPVEFPNGSLSGTLSSAPLIYSKPLPIELHTFPSSFQ